MKIALLIGLLAVLQAGMAEDDTTLNADDLACIAEHNLDKNEIVTILHGDRHQFPEDNTNFNIMVNCYWKKKNYQNEDGTFNYDNIIDFLKTSIKEEFGGKKDSGDLGVELATNSVDGCKDVATGTTHGETAVKFHNCVTKKMVDFVKAEL